MNTKTISIAMLALMAFTACQEAELKDSLSYSGASEIVFTAASGEEEATKTSRQEDGAIWWSAEDEIKVFCGTASGQFVSQSNESAATTTFAGSFDSSVTSDDIASKGVIAFYPYSDDVTCDGETVTFTLPSSQTGVAGSFDDDLFPAIAKSNGTDLSFYNICGGAKFTVSRDDIKTVIFKGNNSEALAGKVRVSFDENGLPQVEVVDGKTEIVVTAPDGGTFEVGKSYYIVTLPQSLECGFEISYNDGVMINNSFKKSEPVTINRSKFGLLTELDANLDMVDMDEPIVFADEVMKELCVNAFDTNADGELSFAEAAAVTDLSQMALTKKSFKTFDEFQYFTSVERIPEEYFYNIGIESIVLPENLTSIGKGAFWNCKTLVNILIPESVTYIGMSAFNGCQSLVSIVIPESVTSIGAGAFCRCSSLSSLTIPEGLRSMGTGFLSGCSSLTSFIVPESVTSIGYQAFLDCSSLTSITLPESIKSIGGQAFKNCSSLTSLVVPGGVTRLEYEAFYGCSSLTSIVIPENVTSIEHCVFENCSSLTNVTIPESISDIRAATFRGCSSLINIIIPESVTILGSHVFSGCSSLASIIIPESVTAMGCEAFFGCSSLADIIIPDGVTEIGFRTFRDCSNLTNCVIPEAVTTIGWEAFYGCSCLTSIVIPENVTSIGFSAFLGCNNLASIYMKSTEVPTLSSNDDMEYDAFYATSHELIIYVPLESVDAYKTAEGWSDYADRIVGYDYERDTVVE